MRVIATTTPKDTIMPSPREGGGNIRLRLDSELAAALDRARDTTNVTRTSYTRTALIRAIRAAGHLPAPGQNAEATR